MGRKNYTKQGRKARRVEYVIAEVSADYEIKMTNGSGFDTVVITGTSVSAWNYAVRMGQSTDYRGSEVWHPCDIRVLGANDALFSVI